MRTYHKRCGSCLVSPGWHNSVFIVVAFVSRRCSFHRHYERMDGAGITPRLLDVIKASGNFEYLAGGQFLPGDNMVYRTVLTYRKLDFGLRHTACGARGCWRQGSIPNFSRWFHASYQAAFTGGKSHFMINRRVGAHGYHAWITIYSGCQSLQGRYIGRA